MCGACALVTPYLSEVVDRIVATCAGAGVSVVAERHLGLSDNHAFGLVTEAGNLSFGARLRHQPTSTVA